MVAEQQPERGKQSRDSRKQRKRDQLAQIIAQRSNQEIVESTSAIGETTDSGSIPKQSRDSRKDPLALVVAPNRSYFKKQSRDSRKFRFLRARVLHDSTRSNQEIVERMLFIFLAHPYTVKFNEKQSRDSRKLRNRRQPLGHRVLRLKQSRDSRKQPDVRKQRVEVEPGSNQEIVERGYR